ncbi:MAG: hypothetical protein K9L68_12065, partial [Spirochaetales bacterium]|nr:hypothetical protein [Spirochaetales bacterium]MCF7939326.1 hypothetical protein [Spirochaetales bacterium]
AISCFGEPMALQTQFSFSFALSKINYSAGRCFKSNVGGAAGSRFPLQQALVGSVQLTLLLRW